MPLVRRRCDVRDKLVRAFRFGPYGSELSGFWAIAASTAARALSTAASIVRSDVSIKTASAAANHRRILAVAVAGIAFPQLRQHFVQGQGFPLPGQLFPASFGAPLNFGIDPEFDLSLRADHGADVAAVENRATRLMSEGTL